MRKYFKDLVKNINFTAGGMRHSTRISKISLLGINPYFGTLEPNDNR